MLEVNVSTYIDAPAALVYAVLTDFAGAPRFMSKISRSDILDGKKMAVGTRVRQTRTLSGREITCTYRVTALDVAQQVAIETEASGVFCKIGWRLTPDGRGTTIATRILAEPKTTAARTVMMLGLGLRGAVERATEAEMVEVRAECERRKALA
ncbi:SRPBCC family protein [Methylobrevis pamukkalensis]|uniref:Polyketide cyclase / dehydrase and lipid transport n=1 Tax=Methylobrevis pamukkalensis TaxID=1439726 RepID=A0A1E3GX35_9HYPH|nr:SRPBCC family protein [Methylobrevis pamukkalensis]ODN68610.1 Polyketide cyclase / dehydrase and lipid transport [Methylobrevis pamukkalensis]